MSDNESHSSMHRVVIVGGGTAGWLAAGILAAKLSANHTVTLIESPNIPSLGVGEGSWPSLRDTLLDIGISETALLLSSIYRSNRLQRARYLYMLEINRTKHIVRR